MKSIKDLIYFDYEKAKSLNSQLSGGVINELTRAIEEEGGLSSEIGFDIKVLKGSIGENNKEKSIRTERIELFHELLNEVEKSLFENKVLKDLNEIFENAGKSFNDFIKEMPNYTYIKATGWSSFEDFERFKIINANFNDIQRLIFTSSLENNKEIIELKGQIAEKRKELRISSKNNNHKEEQKVRAIEKKFDKYLEDNSGAQLLDEAFITRLEVFLNTFSPNRLNFRLAPFDAFSEFQILANLKSEYLVNGDFNNVIYTYGSRPNIKLTLFGVITSCPQKEDIRVDLTDEYLAFSDEDLVEEERFEKAIRGVFSSFENFEKFFFVPRFPKIAVSPLAIYRQVNL
ncbi:MAG: DUF6414 family protein [Bacteroidia bacterium]